MDREIHTVGVKYEPWRLNRHYLCSGLLHSTVIVDSLRDGTASSSGDEMRPKYDINQVHRFRRGSETLTGKIKEITLFRRCKDFGCSHPSPFGYLMVVDRATFYIGEDEIIGGKA